MNPTKKRFLLILLGVMVLSAAAGVAVIAALPLNPFDETVRVNIYHFNPRTNDLEAERRTIAIGEPEQMLESVIAMLYDNPRNVNLRSVLPEALLNLQEPEAWLLNNRVLTVPFPALYYDVPPVEEALFRAALVWSMTELPFVDSVRITVDGNDLTDSFGDAVGLMDRESIRLNAEPDFRLNPDRMMPVDVTLYFVREDMTGLIREERRIDRNQDLPLERFVIESLIEDAPTYGTLAPISQDTRIREVRTEDGLLTINFSDDFITKFSGTVALAELTLQSIVHSVKSNNSSIRAVQFLIESERREVFNGVAGFDLTFEIDESLIP